MDMQTNMHGLATCANASGLTPERSNIVRLLAQTREDKLANNNRQMDYYLDRNGVKNLGIAVPSTFKSKIDTSVGWAAKAVDSLAARSQFDGFTLCGESDTDVDAIMRDNDMAITYAMAVPTELIHGCGAWTVSEGDAKDGEPPVVINYHDATTCAMAWDYRRKRIAAGLIVEDFRLRKNASSAGDVEPCYVVVHLPDVVIEIRRGDGDDWEVVSEQPNTIGRPLMEPMVFKPTNTRPFGKSRISKAVMGIVDDMQREILRTSLHSELFSSIQKAILGVTDKQYDALMANKFGAAMTELFVATRDADGNVPSIQQFQQASMEPHIAAMNKLASRMASETCLPVSDFGVDSSVYQSTESLKASTANLVVEAESLNRNNGRALRNVALLAMCVDQGKAWKDLTPDELAISVHWKDPSMPSVAATSDAMVKQASVAAWLPETSVYWEQLGYDEDQRRRLMSEKTKADSKAALSAIFGSGAVTGDAAGTA